MFIIIIIIIVLLYSYGRNAYNVMCCAPRCDPLGTGGGRRRLQARTRVGVTRRRDGGAGGGFAGSAATTGYTSIHNETSRASAVRLFGFSCHSGLVSFAYTRSRIKPTHAQQPRTSIPRSPSCNSVLQQQQNKGKIAKCPSPQRSNA